MATRPFLAMTAAEIRENPILPEKIAWMACHFSPYGRGLSNLPRSLPEKSLLIVDDITPIHGHDPQIITNQLMECMERLDILGIVLDFQRPNSPETAALVQFLSKSLPCPPAVSEGYADTLDLPVFLSPVPPSVTLQEHLSKWKDRDIWLDVTTWGERIQLSESGSTITDFPPWDFPASGFSETNLHCHYQTAQSEDAVLFTLWRTDGDLANLLEEAERFGVSNTVRLYQEYNCTAK